jgi:hypothetical protein
MIGCHECDYDVCSQCHLAPPTSPECAHFLAQVKGVQHRHPFAPPHKIQGVKAVKVTNYALAATVSHHEDDSSTLVQAESDPTNLWEAISSKNKDKWIKAMTKEWNALLDHGTFKKISIEDAKRLGKRIMTSRWVFKEKRDGTFKARVVVRGFQEPMRHDESSYSPTPHMESLRILLTIGLTKGYEFAGLDVSNAFLNAEVSDKVLCMYPPEGIQIQSGYCLQLVKTLYGLTTSPIRWKELLVDTVFIKEYGLQKVYNEDCLLHGNDLFVLVYVDDIKLTGTPKAINDAVTFLKTRFKVTVEPNNAYLALTIDGTSDGFHVHQGESINKILQEYGMEHSKGKRVPLPHSKTLPVLEYKQEYPGYRRIVGKLMYLLATRPDLSFTMKELARYNDCNNEHHFKAAKGVLAYLNQKRFHGLRFTPLTENTITAFVDASYAEELETRKSTTGKIVFWGTNVISFKSKTQPIVTTSSFQAELVAIASVVSDILWLRHVLDELGFTQTTPSIIYTDSQSVIRWVTSGKSACRQRSKHIDVRAHQIRELVDTGVIELRYVSSEDNIADAFTKSLGPNKFTYHFDKVLKAQD